MYKKCLRQQIVKYPRYTVEVLIMKIVSTQEAFKKAMNNCDFSYDIFFRMAVIDEYLKGNDSIWDLYSRMQHIRCSRNDLIPRNMIDHKQEFIELIQIFKTYGFDFKQPILINRNGLIIDGAHRMACALYFQSPSISLYMDKSFTDFTPDDYSKKWFEENDLSECIPYAEKQKQFVRRRFDVQT